MNYLAFVIAFVIFTLLASVFIATQPRRRRTSYQVMFALMFAVVTLGVFSFNLVSEERNDEAMTISSIFEPTKRDRPQECGDKTTGSVVVNECDNTGRVCTSKSVSCEGDEQ